MSIKLNQFKTLTGLVRVVGTLVKTNPNHDADGRFASGSSGGNIELPEGGYKELKPVKPNKKDRQAIEDYQFNSYEVNGHLRTGIGYAPESIQREAIGFKRAFENNAVETKKDMWVYRGVDEGDVSTSGKHTDKAYVSTSTNPDAAGFHSGGIIMKIKVPRGTKVLPVLQGDEKEIILPKDMMFEHTQELGSYERRGAVSKVHEYKLL